jgi:hypothetical protein
MHGAAVGGRCRSYTRRVVTVLLRVRTTDPSDDDTARFIPANGRRPMHGPSGNADAYKRPELEVSVKRPNEVRTATDGERRLTRLATVK